MVKRGRLPKSEAELEQREVDGFWKAIALSKEIGESNEKITLSTIKRLHKTMLSFAYPDVAGRFRKRGEYVKKLKCIEPPAGGRLVEEQMYEFWRILDAKLAVISRHPVKPTKSYLRKWRTQVIEVAAWAQHKLAAIHPFCEGNGRMARLITNVILRRYGLQPASVNYEGENKSIYIDALCQIDRCGDYEPLKALIIRGIITSYTKEKKIRARKKIA